jgi:hypothetical protein
MHTGKWISAAILCIGIACFAIASIASDGGLFAPVGNPTALQTADDPVHNGLRIIETRATNSPRIERARNDDSTVILLDNWIYTTKGKPSPYN